MDLGERAGGKELGGVEGEEARLSCMRGEFIFN